MTVTAAQLSGSFRRWLSAGEARTTMRRLEEAMRILYPAGPPRTAEELAERVLFSALREHERRVESALATIDETLARLLDDLDALRGDRTLAGRTAELQARDMRLLIRASDDLRSFENQVRFFLGGEDQTTTQLRNQLEAELGASRSFAPVGSAAGALQPPTFRPGTTPNFVSASDELWRALRDAPPAPTAARGVPLTGGQLLGAPSVRVARACDDLITAAGGDARLAVQRILSTGTGPDQNRMVMALLMHPPPQGEARIVGATRASRTGPQADPFAYQERATGFPAEITGRFDAPIRGHLTIGVDGIEGGRVIDAKFTRLPAEESGHLTAALKGAERRRARAAGRPGPDDIADAVDDIRSATPLLSHAEADNLIEQQVGINIVSEMERQLEFARQAGLRGVEFRCPSDDLPRLFEQIFHERLSSRYGTEASFAVVR